MVDSVRYGFRSVLNSQHGDFNGFFNGFQASKSWNAGRYLNKRRTGWWHQCWHVVRPGVILQQLDEWDDWTQWVGNPMEQVGACLAGHPPGCSWFFLREGAYIKWCQWPQQNWWLMTDWSSDDWRWSPGTSKAIQYRFSHPNSWFALWMFLKLGAPRYITQGDICFLCVCVCFCWTFDAAGSKGDGEKKEALEDRIGAFGASHLPLEIQQWTLFNFFGSFVYEHILIWIIFWISLGQLTNFGLTLWNTKWECASSKGKGICRQPVVQFMPTMLG